MIDKRKTVYYALCVFLAAFAGARIYSLYKHAGKVIADGFDRVSEGRPFNDGTDRRESLMSLSRKNVKKSAGVFYMARYIKDQDIGMYADIGFLTFFHYPAPVHYLDIDDMGKCDWFIAHNGFIYKSFLYRAGELGNFKKVDENRDFILMERVGGGSPAGKGEPFQSKVDEKDCAGTAWRAPGANGFRGVVIAVSRVLAILGALLIPAAPGCLMARRLLPELGKRRAIYFVAGLLLGHGMLSCVVYVLWLCFGVEINAYTSAAALLSMALALFLFSGNSGGKGLEKIEAGEEAAAEGREEKAAPGSRERAVFMFLVAVSVVLWTLVAVSAFSVEICDWPGIGIWGLKAKIMCHTGGCRDFLVNRELAYSHPEYPLGYPLTLAWCWEVSGGSEHQLIKIAPFFWGVVSFLLLYSVSKEILGGDRNLALLIALFACGAPAFVNMTAKLYAEPMFFPWILCGMYLIREWMTREETQAKEKGGFLTLGLVMMIFSCWYKNEGMVYLSCAVSGIMLFAFRDFRETVKASFKRFTLWISASLALAVLPWLLVKHAYGIHERDFSLDALSFSHERFVEITGRFSRTFLNKNGMGWGCAAVLALLLIIALGRKLNRRALKTTLRNPVQLFKFRRAHVSGCRYAHFATFACLGAILIFYFAFFASRMPLWWHLMAVNRILFIPEAVLLPVLVGAALRMADYPNSKSIRNSATNLSQEAAGKAGTASLL